MLRSKRAEESVLREGKNEVLRRGREVDFESGQRLKLEILVS